MGMSIREITEWNEQFTLSSLAAKSAKTKGRIQNEDFPSLAEDVRTDYQIDRDRIVHSESFRRLMHKTQVFLSPKSEYYRTRLTHTNEVAQIAKTITRALRLNEDLTEAIALGHDIGHTPFGHNGEKVLSEMLGNEFGGFSHSQQSVRTLMVIEKNGRGLNLTEEVRNGILCHSNTSPHDVENITKEGEVVKFSDKIAYLNHDIEDAVRGGVIKISDLPENVVKILGDSKSRRITTLVTDLIKNAFETEKIEYSPEIKEGYDELSKFMYEHVYSVEFMKAEKNKAERIVKTLFAFYEKNPKNLKGVYAEIAEKEGVKRAAADFIAGMTDNYAIDCFAKICIPRQFVSMSSSN